MELEEKETTINFDESSPDADLLTYSKSLQTRIEKRIGIKPYFNNGYGGKLYTIPKKLVTIKIPRKYSAETRRKMGERLQRNRLIGEKTIGEQGKFRGKRVKPSNNTQRRKGG